MSRDVYDATARRRFALAALVAAGLALVVPALLITPADGTTVSLAVVALVLATLVRLADHGPLLAASLVAAHPPRQGDSAHVPTARITDPAHHPLRPRAPGSV
jgi:hypothetical protein